MIGYKPFMDSGDTGVTGAAGAVVVAVLFGANLFFAFICLVKDKLWTGFFGLFIPFVALVGAIRTAPPTSPWTRRRYAKKPKRMAKAQRREDRINATRRSWREAFFDLIAGKPHLPSVPPLAAHPAQAPVAASEPAAAVTAAAAAADQPVVAKQPAAGRQPAASAEADEPA